MRFAATAVLLASVYLLAIAGAAHSDEPTFAVHTGHGFDWLDPESARCIRIDAARLQSFTRCEFHKSGAFGLPLAYHSCPNRTGGEILVFESAAACTEALETMQANAP